MSLKRSATKRLQRKAKHGFRGFPIATIAFYGPDAKRASKVAVGIVADESNEAADLKRWFAEEGDVRADPIHRRADSVMADKPQTKKIISGASVFLVQDVQRSAAYYRDALGFRFDRFWGDPPDFCMVWRNEQCFILSQVQDPKSIRPVSTVVSAVWDAYLWVDDADAFFAELKERGAKIKYEPFVKPYGVKEFAVFDLDGYQIAFGEELE